MRVQREKKDREIEKKKLTELMERQSEWEKRVEGE